MLKTIVKLFKDYKPLPFFGSIAVLLMFVGVILFIPILFEYNATGLVPRIPTLIVAGFMGMFSLQAFSCGLILDTEGKKSRQAFEIQMNTLQAIYCQHETDNNLLDDSVKASSQIQTTQAMS